MNFWAVEEDKLHRREKMEKDILNAQKAKQLYPFQEDVKINWLVLCPYDDSGDNITTYHRARVVSILKAKNVHDPKPILVKFVDYGNYYHTHMTDLRKLPNAFASEEFLAVKYTLR